MVEGNLNKETQKEIEEAVEARQRAYEIATQSLFRDVSSYSFDSYRRELATDLTLDGPATLHGASSWPSTAGRCQRKGEFLEFLVPDVLKAPGCRHDTRRRRSTGRWRSTDRRGVPGDGASIRGCDAGLRGIV